MSARLVQHLSCLLILIHKVKELLPFWKVIANVLTYFEKDENSVLRMVNQELFGFLLNYICAYANDSMCGIVK